MALEVLRQQRRRREALAREPLAQRRLADGGHDGARGLAPRSTRRQPTNRASASSAVPLLEAAASWPATCVVASNGREALACLAGERFDLVLTDMQMPELDGLAATRALRADEAARGAPRIPIVAMTPNAPVEDLRACRAAGMDDFMPKPFGIAALRDVLARAASHAD